MRWWSRGRRWLAPEVVQSSASDCGPAALGSLLAGYGVAASYEALRDACRTDVDGTSIDDLEALARTLGLDAEQVMLPVDHLLLARSAALPALVVVRGGGGALHFVVVWRRHGDWCQVMDPAVGRRWVRAADLGAEIYLHRMPVPAAAWRQWAGGDGFLRPLETRLRVLGLKAEERRRRIGEAVAEPGCRGPATLDAAARMVLDLVGGGEARRGSEAARLLAWLVAAEARSAAPAQVVPEEYWSARPLDGERVLLRGAVLVGVRGRLVEPACDEPAVRRLARRLGEPPVRPFRELLGTLARRDRAVLGWLAASCAAAAAGGVVEALSFRGLLDLPARLALPEQRAAAATLLLGLLGGLLVLDTANLSVAFRLGRRVELVLRVRLLARLARLGDRYVRSRLSSDLAERCHSVWKLRLAAELAAGFLRGGLGLVAAAVGIVWLDPGSAALAAASVVATVALPLLAQAPLGERELRLRTHAGALARFHLDALLGLVPLRNHAAERAVRREHEALLGEWLLAGLRLERGALALDLGASAVGYGFAIWLVARQLAVGGGAAEVLLLAYWALSVPMRGQELAILGRQLPVVRTAAVRLLEPLRAAIGEAPHGSPAGRRAAAVGERGTAGVALRLEGVAVVAGGRRLLEDVELSIDAGQRVAIVGRSGAGKSTLVGLLLGWQEPAAGRLLVDGEPLDAERLAALREVTAWVDPEVRLWNRPLLDNVRYGARGGPRDPASVVAAAALHDLLADLPQGWRTPLGEGGALVSGGEGQRVRLARALARDEVRLAVLDEPFRGLDRSTRRALLAGVRARWPGATVIAVMHDLAETEGFDRVAVVEAGRVVEQGGPADLGRLPGSRYRRLLDEERAAQARLSSSAWQRLRLADGRLVDASVERPAP